MLGPDTSVSVPQWLLMWAIIITAAVAVIGATTGAGAIVFFLAVVAGLLVAYAVISRVWRFMLYGTFSKPEDTNRGGGS